MKHHHNTPSGLYRVLSVLADSKGNKVAISNKEGEYFTHKVVSDSLADFVPVTPTGLDQFQVALDKAQQRLNDPISEVITVCLPEEL